MKTKVFFYLAVAIFIVACSNHESIDSVPMTPIKSSVNNIRSYEDAMKIAQASISMLNDPKSSTRGESNTRKIDLDNSKKVVKLDAKTRSDLCINDTLIYVFNFQDNEGFILVSASENTEPILAITEQGYYNPEERSEIVGFELFMSMAKNYVATASKQASRSYTRALQKDTIIHSYTVNAGPYVTVKWGQNYPEGEFCSNGLAGCTNTAMAQVMSYYQYPSGISLTYSGADQNYQTLNWTDLKNHNTQNQHHWYSSSCNNQNAHKAIARLHRQLGKLNQSEYENGGTSTYAYKSRQTFINLGYNISYWYHKDYDGYNSYFVRNQLNNAHLLLFGGTLITENNDSIGHRWIADGYLTDVATEYVMELVGSGNHPMWVIVGQYGSATYYYNHFNWGWYGENNGYFLEDVYNTAEVYMSESNTIYNDNYMYEVNYYSVYH